MKKKLSIFLLLVLVFPLFALFGCNEVQTFSFRALASSYNGSTAGGKRYDEGATVKLTAVAKENSYFIAWVFHNKILESDDTYTITNTSPAEDENPNKSEITFVSSQSTEGDYTAVFAEKKMAYVKYDGVMIDMKSYGEYDKPGYVNYQEFGDPIPTQNFAAFKPYLAEQDGNENPYALTNFLNASMILYQYSESVNVYSAESLQFRQGVGSMEETEDGQPAKIYNYATKFDPENMLNVMRLDLDTAQHINAQFIFTDPRNPNNVYGTYNFQADIKFHQNDKENEWTTLSNNLKYHILYDDNAGTYKVVFDFTIGLIENQTILQDGEEVTVPVSRPTEMYLTLFFKNL